MGAAMKSTYGTVTPETIEKLKAIVGEDRVFTERHVLEEYSRDEAPLVEPSEPRVVVKPADTESVAGVLELADSERIPVTPRGAGTGLSGGCVPVHGGIVLSLELMNRILEIDRGNFTAVVEPGVTLAELYKEVEPGGLCYPLYPGEMTATVGGNIATNAGGMNAVKHGVTRHNVLGLEAVLPDGDIINTGGKYVKCSTGYDLTQLIAGSEGTLAVVTKAILRLIPRMAKREMLLAPFSNMQDAIDAVPQILSLRTMPAGIEFLEKSIIQIVEKFLNRELPYDQHEASLLVIAEGESESELHEYFSLVEDICRRHGAIEAMVPGGERAKRRLVEARENFYHALKRYAPMEIIDTVVPRNAIAEFIKRVKRIAAGYDIPIIVYGHAGDGNVHLHPVCVNMDREEWEKKLPRLMSDIYRTCSSLGGAISGEHGIGLEKKAFFQSETDEALLGAMRGIKRAFDPNNILNPGKIFDLET
jgi:glycolate oxidase